MATYDYASIKEKAGDLIERFGTSIQIDRIGSDTTWTKKYDPATMQSYWENEIGTIVYESPEGVTNTWTGKAVLSNWPKSMLDDKIVETSDIRLVVVSEVEVKVGDEITTAAGRVLKVVPPTRLIKPDGETLIVQEVNCRE
jgi:hypothetical protein